MSCYNKDKSILIENIDILIGEYGRLKRGGHKREMFIPSNIRINCICDKCSIEYDANIKIIKTWSISNKVATYCNKCSAKHGKLIKYGKENFNNKEKRIKTNLKRYGTIGVPRNQETREKISDNRKKYYESEKGKRFLKDLSNHKKELFKDKNNHPMYGKKQSKESIEKNRQSNIQNYLNGQELPNIKNKFLSGHFYSKKMNKKIWYRSSFEWWFFNLLEYNNSIKIYEVEKIRISYLFENKNHVYIPDILVTYRNGVTHLIEIKPSRLLNEEKNIEKFKAGKNYIKENNIDDYLILTEESMLTYIFKNCESEDIVNYPEWIKDIIFEAFKKIAKSFF